jgi:4-hydroxy-tetrahydrodipicolinate synthase
MLAHLTAVCDSSSKPVIAYNVPGRTVVGMTAETLIEASKIPNVVGIKEASADLFVDTFVLEAVGDSVALLSGDDATAMPFIALGGHGVISVVGNVAPRLMSEMCAATAAADLTVARRLHQRVCHIHALMFSHPNPIPAKAVTASLGFGSADVRLPLVDLEADELDALVTRARALGVSR